MVQMEHLLNVYASRTARGSIADFMGYCQVADEEATRLLTPGLWLVRGVVAWGVLHTVTVARTAARVQRCSARGNMCMRVHCVHRCPQSLQTSAAQTTSPACLTSTLPRTCLHADVAL